MIPNSEKAPEYNIISSYDMEEFLTSVNEALKSGWQLYGNPFSRRIENSTDSYNQAFIRYKENERTGGFGFSRRE